MKILRILLAIVALGACIAIHEAGHLAAAKLAGIPVESFGIGFLRTLFAIKIGGTEYKLNLIPWGGYVSIPTEAEQAASFGARFALYIGGPLGNLFGAWLLSPLLLTVKREGDEEETLPKLLAFLAFPILLPFFMWNAIVGVTTRREELAGPVGIVITLSRASTGREFLALLAFCNIGVGILNLLPILPLDGGEILLLGLGAIKPGLAQALEPILNEIGFVILALLLTQAFWNDLRRLRHH